MDGVQVDSENFKKNFYMGEELGRRREEREREGDIRRKREKSRGNNKLIRSTTITPTQLSPSRRQFLFLQSHVQSPNSISTSIHPSLNNLLFSRSRQIEHHSLTDVLPAISARNTGFQIYSLGWVSLGFLLHQWLLLQDFSLVLEEINYLFVVENGCFFFFCDWGWNVRKSFQMSQW